MDFSNANINFGKDAVWTKKFKCGWCDEPILNQTEVRYREKGNICHRSHADSGDIMSDHDITMNEKALKEKRKEYDYLGNVLNMGVEGEEKEKIIDQRQRVWGDIQTLKKILSGTVWKNVNSVKNQ